jgi:hypothetical protein
LNETIYHLWHGSETNRKYADRHFGLLPFKFDPVNDIKVGSGGAWEWATDKPAMHAYVKNYFLGRNEDEHLFGMT